MGSRGSEYESGGRREEQRDWIGESQNFDELETALSKTLGNTVMISDEMKQKGNFDKIKRSVSAFNKMVEMFPMLKGEAMSLKWHKTQGGRINGMSAFGEMYFYGKFYKNKNPKEATDGGYFHPKNFTHEQAIAHEIGHHLEMMVLRKMYPGKIKGELVTKWLNGDGFKNVFTQVHQKLQAQGYSGNEESMMWQISGYAKYNWSEAGAEAVADVFSNGKNASNVSQMFVETLLENLK
jgi:hypothetical protein